MNGAYPRNSFPKTKAGAYVMHFDEYKSVGTYWIALYVNSNIKVCFDTFGAEHIPKEIKKIISTKNIITNIYKI